MKISQSFFLFASSNGLSMADIGCTEGNQMIYLSGMTLPGSNWKIHSFSTLRGAFNILLNVRIRKNIL